MRRELNEIEYFNWCFGQPYNMVVTVQIRGGLDAGRLREALEKAQRRHPLLRVNTEIGPDGIPWFDSEGVGPIPLQVIDRAEPDQFRKVAETELVATFDMDTRRLSRPPLLRVTLLQPSDPARPADVLFTVQHIVADGLSMIFLVRDLLQFMEEPDAPVIALDVPASSEDLLPPRVRRHIPTTRLRFMVALWLTQLYVSIRFGGQSVPPKQHALHHRAWELAPIETTRLLSRCRREGVSVQSAICTAFLPGFHAIHTPVNLRALLSHPVGESVGLFVGSADVIMEYRAEEGFWDNARRFHRRLKKARRNPFRIFALFSKAVPAELMRKLGPLMMRIASQGRPFAVTNLGQLDGNGIHLQGKHLKIESFTGAVTAIVDSSVLTVYTIGGKVRLDLLATESVPEETAVRADADRAVQRLLEAIER